jgi:hypothetical protein
MPLITTKHNCNYRYVNEDFLKNMGRYYDEISTKADPKIYFLKPYHSKEENIP